MAQLQRCQIEATLIEHEDGNTELRRLTPVEYERLQGFPDGWTDIPGRRKETPNEWRYQALGNSIAVPVLREIGTRIARVELGGNL